MRTAIVAAAAYLAFLAQAGFGPAMPDLAFILLALAALHEKPLTAVIIAGILGLLLDSLDFRTAGFNLATVPVLIWGIVAIRRYIYRVSWAGPLLAALALSLRWVLRLIAAPLPPQPMPLVASFLLSLAFIPLADWLFSRLLFAGWNPD